VAGIAIIIALILAAVALYLAIDNRGNKVDKDDVINPAGEAAAVLTPGPESVDAVSAGVDAAIAEARARALAG